MAHQVRGSAQRGPASGKALLLRLAWTLLLNLQFVKPMWAEMVATSLPFTRGFAPIHHVSPYNMASYALASQQEAGLIAAYCKQLQQAFLTYHWAENPCGEVAWHADLKSTAGHPLLYAVFGQGEETTLFLGGVHPDELTPIHLAFRFARYLKEHPDLYRNYGMKVIIAPLVNPDGFLGGRLSRTNTRVDINRNFFTIDWYERALAIWVEKRNHLVRYFPGYFPNTEIETLFQKKLIDRFQPDKIFSVHAPLGFLDYDGPGDQKPAHLSHLEKRAKQFVYAIAKKTSDYRVVDYSFYPGSLGNYAGNERNLPTITLELETTLPHQVDQYWLKFLPGFVQSIQYPFRKTDDQLSNNATQFFRAYDAIIAAEGKIQG